MNFKMQRTCSKQLTLGFNGNKGEKNSTGLIVNIKGENLVELTFQKQKDFQVQPCHEDPSAVKIKIQHLVSSK